MAKRSSSAIRPRTPRKSVVGLKCWYLSRFIAPGGAGSDDDDMKWLVARAAVLGLGGRATPAPTRPARFVVMIDAGHGGTNTGAAGVIEGVYEKRVALQIARQ